MGSTINPISPAQVLHTCNLAVLLAAAEETLLFTASVITAMPKTVLW